MGGLLNPCSTQLGDKAVPDTHLSDKQFQGPDEEESYEVAAIMLDHNHVLQLMKCIKL